VSKARPLNPQFLHIKDVDALQEIMLTQHKALALANQKIESLLKALADVEKSKQVDLLARFNELEKKLQAEQKKNFTRSSEQLATLPSSSEESNADVSAQAAPPAQEPKGKTRGKNDPAKRQPSQLPIEVVYVQQNPPPACKACKVEMHELQGQTNTHEVIEYVPGYYRFVQEIRNMYACSCGKTAPAASIAQPTLANNSRYSALFEVQTVIDKFAHHIPLERQASILEQKGICIGSNTLYEQTHHVAQIFERPYLELGDGIREQELGYTDETRWLIYEKSKKGELPPSPNAYFWLLACENVGAYYEVHSTRGYKALLHLLHLEEKQTEIVNNKRDKQPVGLTYLDQKHEENAVQNVSFAGTLMSDGYAPYKKVCAEYGFIALQCWVHIRRYFFNAYASDPQNCMHVLKLIAQLYQHEEAATYSIAEWKADTKKFPFDVPDTIVNTELERRRFLRQKYSKPVFETLKAFVKTVVSTPGSDMHTAIGYLEKRYAELARCFDDPTLPLDNNFAERSLRNAVIGRKNHFVSRSKEGAQVAAILYSLIETCKMLRINPQHYLLLGIFLHKHEERIPLPHEALSAGLLVALPPKR
jgi:transposase